MEWGGCQWSVDDCLCGFEWNWKLSYHFFILSPRVQFQVITLSVKFGMGNEWMWRTLEYMRFLSFYSVRKGAKRQSRGYIFSRNPLETLLHLLYEIQYFLEMAEAAFAGPIKYGSWGRRGSQWWSLWFQVESLEWGKGGADKLTLGFEVPEGHSRRDAL